MRPVYRVFESLDAVVTVVEEARGVPMTSNCVVPRGDVLELLDDVREALPGELDDAQDVLDRRDEILGEAEQEAERIRSAAVAEAHRVVAEARAEAERLLAGARADAERAVADGRRQYAEVTQSARAAHDRFVADGQREQARLVSQTEVVHAARVEAARIVDTADADADRLRRECDTYVDTKLAEFEETLAKALRTVSHGRSQLWRASGGGTNGVPVGRTGTGMDLID
jgi:cell division septum initiation protein DivIVA